MNLIKDQIDYCNLINCFVDIGDEIVKTAKFDILIYNKDEKERSSVANLMGSINNYDLAFKPGSTSSFEYKLEIVIRKSKLLNRNDRLLSLEERMFLKACEKNTKQLARFCIACYLLNSFILFYNNNYDYKLSELNENHNFIIQRVEDETKLQPVITFFANYISKIFINYLRANSFNSILKNVADYYYDLSLNKWKSQFNVCKTCGRIIEKSKTRTHVTHCNKCIDDNEYGKDVNFLSHHYKYESTKFYYDFFHENISILKKYFPKKKITNIIVTNKKRECLRKYSKELLEAYRELKTDVSCYSIYDKYKEKKTD